ncbi:MAG: RDD family protein, partial [Woeseia sp.]
LFFVVFWSRYGRTLGMQSWGLRIEDGQGQLPGIGACSVRFVVALVSWVPAGLGFIWQLIDRDGLSWHDRASGTQLRYYPRPAKDKK